MIGSLLNIVLKKDLIIYHKHRQTNPIIKNKANKEKFIFFEITKLWRLIPFRSYDKRKYKVMYIFLLFLQPRFILAVNWITQYESLYKVWSQKRKERKFIVIQHGSYIGGVVTDIAHKYTKCDIFLTWGDYFTNQFKSLNSKKKTTIKSFGNPVYNQFNRVLFNYKLKRTYKILLAPSGIKGLRLNELYGLEKKLTSLGFTVCLKEHNFQERRFEKIKGIKKINSDIFELLQLNDFDLIITDHSSLMLDGIYFKNKMLFFSCPDNEHNELTNNNFTIYLKNLFLYVSRIESKEDLYNFIDIEKQELLFMNMVAMGQNTLDLC